jgi:integration host factor subunit alpha
MSRTMTRAQLSESIYQEVGLSRNESAELLEMVLGEITTGLVREETVKISSFGSFSVRQKGERIGRNPKTGEEVPIRPRKVLVFRASQLLKARIRGEKISADADRDLDIPDAQPPSGYPSSDS